MEWLRTTEIAKRLGVSRWFFRDWFRKTAKDYPEEYKPKRVVHYQTHTGKGGKFYLWNPRTMTGEFIARLLELNEQRKRRGLSAPRYCVKRTKNPQPERTGIEIYCPWRGYFLTLEKCQECWCAKPDTERPPGYQWQEHCQRGVSVEDHKRRK